MPHEVLLAAAFSAGVVVIFSPCAAALLPAYLSYYLAREQAEPSEATGSAVPRALTFDLVAIALGLVILILAVVDRVLTFGDRTFFDGVLAVVGFIFVIVGMWHLRETKALMEPIAFARLRSQLLRGLVFGGAASLGIAGVYLAMGLVIRLGFSSLVGFLPWIAFGTALVVVVLGVLMLLGVPMLSYTVPMQGFRSKTLPGFVLFGAGYGSSRLAASCPSSSKSSQPRSRWGWGRPCRSSSPMAWGAPRFSCSCPFPRPRPVEQPSGGCGRSADTCPVSRGPSSSPRGPTSSGTIGRSCYPGAYDRPPSDPPAVRSGRR